MDPSINPVYHGAARSKFLQRFADEWIDMANSDRSSQNSQTPHHAAPDDARTEPGIDAHDSPREPPADESSLIARASDESSKSHADRLRRIRADVKGGKYDSDELLEQAIEMMLGRISHDIE